MKASSTIIAIVLACAPALAGCASVRQQQAATMGGIQGAAVGAAVGARNGDAVGGAVVGGIIGATTAAVLSTPDAGRPLYVQPVHRDD